MKHRLIILILTLLGLTVKCPASMVEAPEPCAQKAYTRYQEVTDHYSEQWKLIQTLKICDDGYLRDKDGFVAAALGSYFGDIGSRWYFVCEDNTVIPIIKVDEKQDVHTDWETHTKGIISGTYDENGNVVRTGEYIEFYIEINNMPDLVYTHSDPCINNSPGMDGVIIGWVAVD